MSHKIAKAADGRLVPVGHVDADSEHDISGELRRVEMWNGVDRNGHYHAAVDYVPVEFVDEYVARAHSNAHRDVASGDRAWDHVTVGNVHDDGPGGPNQHWQGDGTPTPVVDSVADPRGGATMMLTVAIKTVLATAYIGACTFVGLTSTVPTSSTGTEISGGSPAYARVAASWGAAGATVTGTPGAINVASGTTVVGVQYWNASTAGTYEDGATVTSQAFASQGTYTVSPTLTMS